MIENENYDPSEIAITNDNYDEISNRVALLEEKLETELEVDPDLPLEVKENLYLERRALENEHSVLNDKLMEFVYRTAEAKQAAETITKEILLEHAVDALKERFLHEAKVSGPHEYASMAFNTAHDLVKLFQLDGIYAIFTDAHDALKTSASESFVELYYAVNKAVGALERALNTDTWEHHYYVTEDEDVHSSICNAVEVAFNLAEDHYSTKSKLEECDKRITEYFQFWKSRLDVATK